MLQAVFNALFACVHRRTTFPRSRGRTPVGTLPRTYVVCLDCGREIPYDWGRMKFGPPAALAAETKGRQRRESGRGHAGRAPWGPEAIRVKAPPDTAPVIHPQPQLNVAAVAEAGADPPATSQAGSAGGLATGLPPVDWQPKQGSGLTDGSVCPTLGSADLHASGAGAFACQPLYFQLPTPPVRPIAQQLAPAPPLPGTALPTAPVFRASLFTTSQGDAAKASNAAHTSESDGRRYLDRAGLRFRKVQVALRVLNSLMSGASAQPGDVAQLVSWADPSNRGRPAGELARQVVEWAGSC